jgi:hypothetical protein
VCVVRFSTPTERAPYLDDDSDAHPCTNLGALRENPDRIKPSEV